MTPRKPKTDQQRLPRKRRAKSPPPIQLTERDGLLLDAVLSYRFILIEHFEWLFPADSIRGIMNRLRLLYHHRYLDRVNLPVSKSANKMIYSLTEKGAQLLAEMQGVSREDIPWNRHLNKVTPTHINHLLTINRIIIAFTASLEKAEARGDVERFAVKRGESQRNRISVSMRNEDGRRVKLSVVPDAIMPVVFRHGRYGLFFIEIDRATMTTARWQQKVEVYREYARSPELLRRFKSDWFILLTATTSARRIDSLAAATVQMGGKRGYWFTTIDKVKPGTALDKLWMRGERPV